MCTRSMTSAVSGTYQQAIFPTPTLRRVIDARDPYGLVGFNFTEHDVGQC